VLWCQNESILLFQVAQLHHELNLKDELLQFYTSAAEESEDDSTSSPMSAFFWLFNVISQTYKHLYLVFYV